MSELRFNLKDSKGIQRFITPLITITHDKKVTRLDKNISLPIGYIVKAVVEGGDSYTDKTKCDAGLACHETLAGLPAEAKLSLYMPIKDADRDSDDLAKWSMVVSLNMGDMAKAAQALASASGIMTEATGRVNDIAKSVKPSHVTVNEQPSYFASEGVSKKRGGSKVIAITLK